MGDIFPCRPTLTGTSYLVKRLSLMRTVLSVILPVVRFFQKFRSDIILWKGRGKMIFPPNYIARSCVRNWGLSLLSPLSLLGRAGVNCHL